LAWKWALKNGIEVIVHRPNYNKDGRWAPLKRNDIIVNEADKIMAFWDGKSTGTKYVIRVVRKLQFQNNFHYKPQKAEPFARLASQALLGR
jgi:uncharacterized phage-like protein YoqJ